MVKPFTASTDSERDPVSRRAAHWLGGVAAVVGVYTFGGGIVCAGGDIVSDGALQVADFVDLLADVHELQIEVLAADEVDIEGGSRPI